MVVYKQVSRNIFKTWLLLALFFGLILSLGWFFSQYYGDPGIMVFAFLFSSLSAIFSYWFSDRIVLSLSGAKEIAKKSDFPELYRIVENLTITAGLPMPKIYVIDDPSPNAFATGRDPKNAVVAVHRGLLETLDKDEVEGVIAHELSHIGNRDILIMTIVVVLVGAVQMMSDWFLRSRLHGFGRRDRDNDNRAGGILMLVGFVLVLLSPIFAMLIQMAVSRKREFLADADAVLLTRHPEGLANALRKISRSRVQPIHASSAMSHLYIASPFKEDVREEMESGRFQAALAGNDEDLPQASWFQTLFSTHPPVRQRIAMLEKMGQ